MKIVGPNQVQLASPFHAECVFNCVGIALAIYYGARFAVQFTSQAGRPDYLFLDLDITDRWVRGGRTLK